MSLYLFIIVSGVLYVHLHGATNLLASDKNGSSDPYCVVFSERKRVSILKVLTSINNRKILESYLD